MFKERSNKLELLDNTDISFEDIKLNMQELNTINSYLGGYQVSINALNKILKNQEIKTIVDIGCGSGDCLNFLNRKLNNNQINFFGIDYKQECIDLANQKHSNKNIFFHCDDYRNVSKYISTIDILHASLFCHHLQNEQIIELIKTANQLNAILLINDLHRNRLAYYSIKFLTTFFSSSYLVKNDAPLSVLRGFSKQEWKNILFEAGVKKYSLKWKWAFRHQIIIYPNEK